MKITVQVVDRGERGFYLRWRDGNGKIKEQAAGSLRRRDVVRLAIEKERQLRALTSTDGAIAWEDWRETLADYYGGLSSATEARLNSVLNQIEKSLGKAPETLSDITTATLTAHAVWMRKLGRSENTIAGHFRAIRAALSWSVDQGMLESVPKMPRVSRASGGRSRGRPLTDKEFQTLLQAVPAATEPGTAESWTNFLKGLWYSGLRLSEALKLTWEPSLSGIWLDFTNDRPKLVIRSHAEKGNRDRMLPLTPDFADFLAKMSLYQARKGTVFAPLVRYGRITASSYQCSHVICAIGRASGIVTEPGRFVTAHDLRRSFCLRWATLVTPAVLQQLARHSSITTTLEFYARADADRWHDEIYSAWAKKSEPGGEQQNRSAT